MLHCPSTYISGKYQRQKTATHEPATQNANSTLEATISLHHQPISIGHISGKNGNIARMVHHPNNPSVNHFSHHFGKKNGK